MGYARDGPRALGLTLACRATVMQIQHQNRISAFTIFGNWARTIFLWTCHLGVDARFGVQD